MFVGGRFTDIVTPDSVAEPQRFLAKFDIGSGAWDPTFRPVIDGRVWEIEPVGDDRLLISWWVWGMWPLEWMKATATIRGGIFWNLASWFWPRGIWLGLVLLWAAWKTQEELYALTASIFLTPYLAFYSFTPLVVVLIGRNRVMGGLVWGCLWILHLVMRREAMGL